MDDINSSSSSSVPGDMPSLQGDDSAVPPAPDVPQQDAASTSSIANQTPAAESSIQPDQTLPVVSTEEPQVTSAKPDQTPGWGMGEISMSPLENTPAMPVSEPAEGPPLQPEPIQPPNEQPPTGNPATLSETVSTPPGTEAQTATAPTETPPAAPTEETLVIPPAGGSSANPFVPQGATAQEASPPPGGNPLMKRILTILVILLVLVGVGAGILFIIPNFSGSKEATLTYWGLWENNATIQTILTDFQAKNPKIKVQYVKQSPRQYRERLQAAITRGEGPDVFEFHNTWVPMLRNELSPAPATTMTASEFGSTFYPVAAADLVGGSSIYGIPMMIDGLGLYYNADLLSTAGVTPPTTWPEVLDIVPKLTVKVDTQIQKSAIAIGTTGNVENFSDIIALMMMQNGAKLISPTGKEAEDTLTFYRKFSNPSDPAYTWNDSMDNSVYAFATGKVAMMIAPSWRAFDIKQINPNLNFKVAPVPQLPGNTINWASYWVEGVSTKSKSTAAAWTFVKYLTDSNTVTKLYGEESKARLFGEPYARVALGSTLASDPYVGAYISEAPTAKSFPLASRTFDNGLNDKLIKYLTDAVNSVSGGNAPTDALNTMSQGFAQVLGSYGLSAGGAPTTTP